MIGECFYHLDDVYVGVEDVDHRGCDNCDFYEIDDLSTSECMKIFRCNNCVYHRLISEDKNYRTDKRELI